MITLLEESAVCSIGCHSIGCDGKWWRRRRRHAVVAGQVANVVEQDAAVGEGVEIGVSSMWQHGRMPMDVDGGETLIVKVVVVEEVAMILPALPLIT